MTIPRLHYNQRQAEHQKQGATKGGTTQSKNKNPKLTEDQTKTQGKTWNPMKRIKYRCSSHRSATHSPEKSVFQNYEFKEKCYGFFKQNEAIVHSLNLPYPEKL